MRLTDLTGALRVQRLLGTADKDVKALKYRSDKCEPGMRSLPCAAEMQTVMISSRMLRRAVHR